MNSRGQSSLILGISWSQTSRSRLNFSTPLFMVSMDALGWAKKDCLISISVMVAAEADFLSLANHIAHKSPFSIEGAPNVVLETIKRAEDDPKKKLTRVVLRVFEAYGGHATATLRVANQLAVDRAYTTNLLEEKIASLEMVKQATTGDTLITLPMRGFQILTVRLNVSANKTWVDSMRRSIVLTPLY
jgi:hypothetical protein